MASITRAYPSIRAIWTLDGGTAIRVQAFDSHEAALEAAGLVAEIRLSADPVGLVSVK